MNENPKVYYSISEVCGMTGLEPHVLRYWESEFPQLRPKKNRAGNRAYRDKDIKIIDYIKYLLYEEKFTIPGAKKKLAESKEHFDEQEKQETPPQPKRHDDRTVSMKTIKEELGEMLRMLKE
ncbi:MAG: MerR family transcriptional regulator [Chitinispirillaceae bacterium]|nr:MerR family transcriptional regulator [Chitinispirillaceae bacterium]